MEYYKILSSVFEIKYVLDHFTHFLLWLDVILLLKTLFCTSLGKKEWKTTKLESSVHLVPEAIDDQGNILGHGIELFPAIVVLFSTISHVVSIQVIDPIEGIVCLILELLGLKKINYDLSIFSVVFRVLL